MDRYDYGKKLWDELWKRKKDGYYDDKPFQFSKDELYIRYLIGWINEGRYIDEKNKLDQAIYEYHWLIKDKSRNKKYPPYFMI